MVRTGRREGGSRVNVIRTLRQQWIGVLGVIIGLTGVAYGATGQPVLLGKANIADKTTVMQNTGAAPAVSLKVKAGQPPFIVNSGVQVPNLKATKLGGKPASAFAAAGSSYLKMDADNRFAPKTGSTSYAAAGSSYLKTDSDIKYAPKTGSTSYAATGSSYLKSESDSKYIDTSEIGGYYTKSQVDSGFAPAAGSPNYVPTGALQLHFGNVQRDPGRRCNDDRRYLRRYHARRRDDYGHRVGRMRFRWGRRVGFSDS